MPLAERHGLIDPLTQWGLRTTLRQWLKWREQGPRHRTSPSTFRRCRSSISTFPDLVERMCRALEVPTDRLVLELTEGATQPLVKLMDTLTRFRIKGIGLAIDDFGTGYSIADAAPPAALHRSEDRPLLRSRRDRRPTTSLLIVKAIIDLAHGLGLTRPPKASRPRSSCVLLRELGCDVGQGYWIAQPLEPEPAGSPGKTEFAERWAPADPDEPQAASNRRRYMG